MSELVELDVSELSGLLEKFARRGRSFREITPQVAEILVTAVDDEFDTEGQSSGGWAPLAPSTVAGRRKGGLGAKILQDSSNLVGNIRPDYGSDYGEAATDVPYAIFHVSSAPRKKLPKRDFLAVDRPDVLEEIANVLGYALVEL